MHLFFGDAISVKNAEQRFWLHGYLTNGGITDTNRHYVHTKKETVARIQESGEEAMDD
jgi:hypothetical protein